MELSVPSQSCYFKLHVSDLCNFKDITLFLRDFVNVFHTVSASPATWVTALRCCLAPYSDRADGVLLVSLTTVSVLLWMHLLNATKGGAGGCGTLGVGLPTANGLAVRVLGGSSWCLALSHLSPGLHINVTHHSQETVGPACPTLGESGETEPEGGY